ncbi:GNAT family N-acetyltransferase [Nonomuraea terrae]|uniref:GNAT family N-acetyltransferase n=1 Tax=Nonomuraea terrae TaxID=2530383 RepID=UPI00378C36A7
MNVDPYVMESSEAAGLFEFGACAPAGAREILGVESARLGGGVVLSMRNDPANYWNKALGFGFSRPVTADLIGEVLDLYRSRGVPAAVLQLAPSVLPPDWEDIRAAYGLSRERPWVKLARDLSEVPPPLPEPAVERVGADTAAEWASLLLRGFGMPEGPLADVMTVFADHPRFRAYLIRVDGEPVTAAGMFVGGETAQLFGCATLEPHRGHGGQRAMLRARLADAAAAGCRTLFSDTGAELPGEHNTSLHNMKQAGFVPVYERDNWRWQADPA